MQVLVPDQPSLSAGTRLTLVPFVARGQLA
jgi:hypothetical protein